MLKAPQPTASSSRGALSRRVFVESLCGGLGAVGLSGMLASDLWAASSPVGPHFAPAAKHVIFLFLTGGPSHLDLFDPKPALEKYAGQRPDSVDLRVERVRALAGIAQVQAGLGKIDDAIQTLREAIAGMRRINELRTAEPARGKAKN